MTTLNKSTGDATEVSHLWIDAITAKDYLASVIDHHLERGVPKGIVEDSVESAVILLLRNVSASRLVAGADSPQQWFFAMVQHLVSRAVKASGGVAVTAEKSDTSDRHLAEQDIVEGERLLQEASYRSNGAQKLGGDSPHRMEEMKRLIALRDWDALDRLEGFSREEAERILREEPMIDAAAINCVMEQLDAIDDRGDCRK
jgi:hypothetical protein